MKKKLLIIICYFVSTINTSYAEIIDLKNPIFDKKIFIPQKKNNRKNHK
jgi:hypothetical protein